MPNLSSSSCSSDGDEWGAVALNSQSHIVELGVKSTKTNSRFTSTASSTNSTSSDDDEWGDFNIQTNVAGPSTVEVKENSSIWDNCMFIPEPILSLDAAKDKPKLPFLDVKSLPPGTVVWVGDEEDVAAYLKKHWNSYYDKICNGHAVGTVVRHSNDMTLVEFSEVDLRFTLTIPRSCLSVKKIEPYDSSQAFSEPKKTEGLYTYFGKLNPRNTRTTSRDSQLANQLLYEAVSISSICTDNAPILEKALTEFNAGSFSKALLTVNSLLGTESLHPCRQVDFFLLRSRIFVFENRYEQALDDALECIRLEPRWVRGYLSAARALSGLGDFDGAHRRLLQARGMLPFSADLLSVLELNSFLRQQQKMLRKKNLILTLDHVYRKRLRPLTNVSKLEVLLLEQVPSVITASLFCDWPANRCKRCFKLYENFVPPQMELDLNEANLFNKKLCLDKFSPDLPHAEGVPGYCTMQCYEAARESLRLKMQFQDSVVQARNKLRSISSLLVNARAFEIANLAIPLFFAIVQKHKEMMEVAEKKKVSASHSLVWSTSAPVAPIRRQNPTLNAALIQTGYYPLITGPVGDSVKECVIQVYETLTKKMSEEDKIVYNADFFVGLYRYVHGYYVATTLASEASRTPETFFFIPRFVGCTYRRSEIEWLARVEIDLGNWNSEDQLQFSLRTATSCGVEVTDISSVGTAICREMKCSFPSYRCTEVNVSSLALVAKKDIAPYSLLVSS